MRKSGRKQHETQSRKGENLEEPEKTLLGKDEKHNGGREREKKSRLLISLQESDQGKRKTGGRKEEGSRVKKKDEKAKKVTHVR